MKTTRIGSVAAALLALALLVSGCTSASSSPPSPSHSSSASRASAAGTKGAVDFDAGYITLGSGKIVVDTYIDPMCPYCAQFEKASGAQLAEMVNAGTITLHIHPLTFLDQSSQGTHYSSRASSAITCVAAETPASTLVYLSSVYANQPEEGSTGLTDAQLVELATSANASSASSCITANSYVSWAEALTARALSKGGVKNADITSIQGTPTIIVNGHTFRGDFTSASAVTSFIAAGGSAR